MGHKHSGSIPLTRVHEELHVPTAGAGSHHRELLSILFRCMCCTEHLTQPASRSHSRCRRGYKHGCRYGPDPEPISLIRIVQSEDARSEIMGKLLTVFR